VVAARPPGPLVYLIPLIRRQIGIAIMARVKTVPDKVQVTRITLEILALDPRQT
jgi:hypothetical protein